jgi:hypothetical protein
MIDAASVLAATPAPVRISERRESGDWIMLKPSKKRKIGGYSLRVTA